MIKELHLHYLPNILKKSEKDFIAEIESIAQKYDTQTAIRALKISGICFSPYRRNEKNSLLDTCFQQLLKIDPKSQVLIDKLISEIDKLKLIFADFNEYRDSSGVNSVPKDLQIASFLITVEIVIQLFNRLLRGEKAEQLKDEYPIILFFIDKEKFADIGVTDNPRLHVIIDNFMEDAGEILKYFNFLGINNIDFQSLIPTQYLIANIEHLTLFDRWKVLLKLFNCWKYYNWEIVGNPDNIIEFISNDIENYFAFRISVHRYRAIRTKWQIEYSHFENQIKYDENSYVLPPNQFISPLETLSSIFMDSFLGSEKLNAYVNGIGIAEWLRSYFVLMNAAKKYLSNQNPKRETVLKSWVLSFTYDELKSILVKSGIDASNTDIILHTFFFNTSSKDLIDSPLIKNNEQYFVLPSLVKLVEPASALFSNFISKRFDISFKGEGFETRIKSLLSKNAINNSGLYQKLNGEEYECDIVANIESKLIFFECKSFVQPNDIPDYYDLQYKIEDAILQLDRIVNHFSSNLDFIKNKLGLEPSWNVDNVIKIVVTSSMIGNSIFDRNTFVIDDSALSRFLNREPYGIRVGQQLYVKPDDNFVGTITINKITDFLNNPPQISMMRSQFRTIEGRFKLKNKTIVFEDKYKFSGDFLPISDEQFEKLKK